MIIPVSKLGFTNYGQNLSSFIAIAVAPLLLNPGFGCAAASPSVAPSLRFARLKTT
jgi:hypothetical protein